MKKYIVFFILISISLFISSCSKEEIKVKKYYETALVDSGVINENNDFVGYTDSFDTIILSAKIGGKITSINKEIGDKVEMGELVAELDGAEAKTGFSSSLDIINQLQILQNSTSLSFDKQIEAMDEKIKQLETSIEIAQIGIDGTTTGLSDVKNSNTEQLKTIKAQIEQAQTSLETAKLNLENNSSSLEQKKSDIYNNSKNAISNANILGSNIIDFLDNLYGVTESNKYKNDSFEVYLSAKNTTLKTDLENKIRNIIKKFNEIKNLDLSSNENIEIALNSYNNLFSQDFRNLLKANYLVLENSISSSDFTEATINSYKSQSTIFQNNLESVILTVSGNYFLGLKGSLDSISSFKKESKSSLDMLQKQVILAEKQIDTLNQTYKQYETFASGQISDVNTKKDLSEKQKELVKNQLSEAKKSKEALIQQKQSSLSQIETQIAQVKASKNDASVMIDNSKVTSPISGTIIKKLAEVGQVVGAGTPILTVATTNDIKVIVSVTDDIKEKLLIGDKVSVEIDGFDKQLEGNITNILPTLDQATKKTQIEIKISNPENKIKIGSYTKVYFSDENKQETKGLIIPNKAILSDMLVAGVYKIEEQAEKCIGDTKCVSSKMKIAK
ncbi:MAG: efflux RND transporter periplasmic adaptor subunit, partial [Candidatus Gracilibacteria bacterium]|nr:efflux RND transporter periplasmic adaptor subunit [Candidatus Gracilibacteria bacterium]